MAEGRGTGIRREPHGGARQNLLGGHALGKGESGGEGEDIPSARSAIPTPAATPGRCDRWGEAGVQLVGATGTGMSIESATGPGGVA